MSVFSQKKSEVPSQRAVSIESSLPSVPGTPSVIGKSIVVKGEVVSDEDVVIDGKVEGKISVKKKLTIGRNAHIQADIEAFSVSIQGKVNGDVRGKSLVELVPGSWLQGNVYASKIVISEGAYFEGNVDMKSNGFEKNPVADHKKETVIQLEDSREARESKNPNFPSGKSHKG